MKTLRHTASVAALLAPALLLSGCRVGPKYVRPTVPTYQAPAAYQDQWKEQDPHWKPANPADATLRGDWWTLFQDPELNLLQVKCGIQNQTLIAAEARFREARAQVGIDNAARFPTIGADPFAGAERYSAARPYFNALSANNGLGDVTLPITFSYEIDLFGRIRRTIDAAKEEEQATAADRQTAELAVRADLAIDYFELRSADATRKLLDETIGDYQDALRITTNRFEGGVTNESDVFQAQTQLQAAIVQRTDTILRRQQFEHAIAILIGQPPNSFSLPEQPLTTTPPFIPAGLPSQLLERRPDIAAAERRTAEANQRIGIARAAFFPTLDLAASFGLDSTSLVNYFSASNIAYALGPTLGQTLYDAGRRRSAYRQAFAAFDEGSANYKQTVLTAFQEVEDNLVALHQLQQESDQQRAATAAAQNAQRIFNNRYLGGLDTYLQVVTAQQTSLNNERNDIDILRRRMDASVLLIKALGGGWNTARLPPV